jgi:MFS family permease
MPEGGPGRGRRLPPVVRALGAVSFFNDLASEMVYPLLPQLMTRGLGAGALALGALDGVSDAVASAVKLGAGWLSDRPRWRKPLILGGYLVAAVTRPLMGTAALAWQVVGLRAVDRVGKGARNPPRDAVIADAVDRGLRGRAFGYQRAMDHAGAMVGPLVAAGLMAAFALDAGAVILWSVVPGLAAVVVAVFALRALAPRPAPVAASPAADADADPPPAALIGLVLLFAALRMPEALLLLRLQDLGVVAPLIPVLWAALHVVRSGASYPGGWLSDRIGAATTMVLGWGVYAAAVGAMAVAAGPWGGALAFLAFGLVSACTESPERALVAAWAGRARRGRGYGLYHAGVGLVALPGGLALGALYQWRGGGVALAVSAGGALLLGAAGALTRRTPVG